LGQPRLLAQGLALGTNARVEHAPRPRQLDPKSFEERLRAFLAQLEALARASQAVQRRGGLLAPARRVGELLLDAAPLFEQRFQSVAGLLAGRPPGRHRPPPCPGPL